MRRLGLFGVVLCLVPLGSGCGEETAAVADDSTGVTEVVADAGVVDAVASVDVAPEVAQDVAILGDLVDAAPFDANDVPPDDGAGPDDGDAAGGDLAETAEDVHLSDGQDLPADLPDVSDVPAADAPDGGPEVTLDVVVDVMLDTGPPMTPLCQPALAISGAPAYTLSLQLFELGATGGTGAYRFAITTNASGGIINELSGDYIPGPGIGTDTLSVTDVGCMGAASVQVKVVEPIIIAPALASVLPGTSFTFQVTGGSPLAVFELTSSGSGASVTAGGVYTAGSEQGVDIVTATDTWTGATTSSGIFVSPDATGPVPLPAAWVLPVGGTVDLVAGGGTGSYTWSLVSGDQTVVTLAVAPGLVKVAVTDSFTGVSAIARVAVVGGPTVDIPRTGDQRDQAVVVAPGDLDGDGFDDLIVGHWESDLKAFDGGSVQVYRGTADGLEVTPALVLGADERRARFGFAIVVANVVGDAAPDLIVGAQLDDGDGVDRGSVRVYAGIQGGLFEPEPVWERFGDGNYHYFGSSVAACDFNGDGFNDLAVGLPRWESESSLTDQGGVDLFLGSESGLAPESGLASEAAQRIEGRQPGADGWVAAARVEQGSRLESGDLTGDGLCDLVAVGDGWPANEERGLIVVYAGRMVSDADPGGLDTQPVWSAAGAGDHTHLGWSVVVGDVLGDSAKELIVGGYGHDAGTATDAGLVHVYAGIGGGDVVPSWTYEGVSSYAYAGWSLAVGDYDGVGPLDLVVTERNASIEGGRRGRVSVFVGGSDGVGTEPAAVWEGADPGAQFGDAAALLGDIDGDGLAELATMVARDDSLGYRVGRPWVLTSAEEPVITMLDWQGSPAGIEFGRGADVVGDVTGDGFPDLVVGAPQADWVGRGIDIGAAYLYEGTAEGGFASSPGLVLGEHVRDPGNARFGEAVSAVGDFDGDGLPDFAVLARYEDRPPPGTAPFFHDPVECTEADPDTSSVGAVYIYLGSAAGLPSATPAFAWFGPQANQYLDTVAGGGDVDGDGFDDLVVGSQLWDGPAGANTGGYAIIGGRQVTSPGTTYIVCEPLALGFAPRANARLGASAAIVSDIDGDGCDEVALGARLETIEDTQEGTVRLLLGFGAGCATLGSGFMWRSDESYSYFGTSMAVGPAIDLAHPSPVDGGPPASLVVGAPRGTGSSGVASVRLISIPLAASSFVDVFDLAVTPLVAPIYLSGPELGARFGQSLAIVPTTDGAAVWVGSPSSDTVAATLYQAKTATLAFGAETFRPKGLLGERVFWALAAGGEVVLGLAGYDGNAVGLDAGSVYSFALTAEP